MIKQSVYFKYYSRKFTSCIYKNILLVPVIILLISVSIFSSSYSIGPGLGGHERTGITGTPGCGGTGCHGASTTINLSIELLNGSSPASEYVPGNTYTIRITGTNTSNLNLPKFGFQVATVKNATTINAGVIDKMSTNEHLTTVKGINVVEHASAHTATTGTGNTGSTYVADVKWQAPSTGSGTITIYTILNAVNGNKAADTGDKANLTSLSINEQHSSSTETFNSIIYSPTFNVYPNPNNGTFNIETSNEFNNGTVSVYSILGKLICKSQISNSKLQITIDQPEGIYLVKLQQGNQVIIKPVSIQ